MTLNLQKWDFSFVGLFCKRLKQHQEVAKPLAIVEADWGIQPASRHLPVQKVRQLLAGLPFMRLKGLNHNDFVVLEPSQADRTCG